MPIYDSKSNRTLNIAGFNRANAQVQRCIQYGLGVEWRFRVLSLKSAKVMLNPEKVAQVYRVQTRK